MGKYSHIAAGFSLGFQYRKELKTLLTAFTAGSTILTLDPEKLRESGITVLALDFDGVLAHHGAPEPLQEAVAWIKRCEAVFSGERIFILSNKPTEERKVWFAEHFPAMSFISGVRKKPYPDGLIKTAQAAGVTTASILMVDDRLLTGCLAALTAGARPFYISKPYHNYAFRPFAEIFFRLLRTAERIFIKATASL